MSTENSPPSADSDLQFGLAVRARRAQLAITLDQLAQASGVTSGALSRVERGLACATPWPLRAAWAAS
jgi:transcriptional regulator with XRE-family HTH domain